METSDVVLKDLIDQLADVCNEPEFARVLVLRSGLPRGRLPPFDEPLVFWTKVIQAAADGLVHGGVPTIVDEAASQFPANEVFARYRAGAVRLEPSAAHDDRMPGCAAREDASDDQQLDSQALMELAKVYCDRDHAMAISIRAGFPPQRLPAFSNASRFWDRVGQKAHNGLLKGGIKPIVAQAAVEYPGNPVFLRYIRRHCSARATSPGIASTNSQGKVSLLAILQTIVAIVALLVAVPVGHPTSVVAATLIVAPLLLLRTDRSTELGLQMFWRCAYEAQRITAAIEQAGWRRKVMKGLLVWLLTCSCCGLLGQASGVQGSWILFIIHSFLLPFAVYWFIFFTIAPFGLAAAAMTCRLLATVASSVTHPIDAIRAIRTNWLVATAQDDLLKPGELLPGLDVWRQFARLESLDRKARGAGYLSFDDFMFHNYFSRLVRIGWSSLDAWGVIFYQFEMIMRGLVVSVVFRLALKSTAIVYGPLFWSSHISFASMPLRVRLQLIVHARARHLVRAYSWGVLVVCSIGVVLALYSVETNRFLPGLTRPLLRALMLPISFDGTGLDVSVWHVFWALSAIVYLVTYYAADWFLLKLKIDTGWRVSGFSERFFRFLFLIEGVLLSAAIIGALHAILSTIGN